MTTTLHPNLIVSSSKAYKGLFSKLRDVNTTSSEFVFYAQRVMRLLVEDTIAEIPTKSFTITTPCGKYEGCSTIPPINKICAVSIVRSGDALLESIRECLPGVPIGKILIQRNEESKNKEAKFLYSKLPKNIKDIEYIILCDPMLATGGSATMAINVLINDYGIKQNQIIFMNVICCPEGLNALATTFPNVKIVTACIDECLNDEKFIVPGLGDYGDRFFNT